jgi:hypothetical protein
MKRYAYPLAVIALLGVVCAPILLHPGDLLYPQDGQVTDLTITHWPAVAFNLRSLRQDGQIPLWRTTVASGGLWAANPQSWLLYPPAWLFFLLPIPLTFNLLLLSHLLLAALATYAFGRRTLSLEPPGAALASLAYALTPWLSGHLCAGHTNVVLALAWLPVALLAAHRAATTGRASDVLLVGVAWAAAVLNHIQMAAFSVALTLAWYLLLPRLLPAQRSGPSVGRKVVHLLAMSSLALLLSAALLLPLAEALPYLNRTGLTADQAGIYSLPPAYLLTALIPTYGGEPEQVVYLGLPVALLALAGLALKPDRVTWFWVIVALLAAVFALGINGPLFPLVARILPLLSWLRVPPRAWILVAWSLALLAGRGLDALTRPRLNLAARRRVTLIALVALVAGLLLAAGLLLLYRPAPPAAGVLAVFSLATAVALLLRARSRLRPTLFAVAILLLATLDLGLTRAAWTEMVSPADAFAWGAEMADYLAQQPGQFRTYSPSYSLPQHTALQHNLDQADGIDPIQLRAYAEFLAAAGGYQTTYYSPSLPPYLGETTAQPDARLLGLLNVAYVAAEWPISAEGLVLETQIGTTYIYHNEQLLPRAFVVAQSRQERQSGDVSLAWPIEALPARIVQYTPNHITVEADLDAPGLLVLSEVWYPDWQATVDGSPTPIQRVEGTLRGVYLDAGFHVVAFDFRPWTVRVGLAISAGAVLALAFVGIFHAWRQR